MTLQEAKEHQAKEFLIKRLNLSPIAASNVYREYVLACSEYAQSAAQEAREKAIRETLISFLNWHQSENLGIDVDTTERVDEYLKLLNLKEKK